MISQLYRSIGDYKSMKISFKMIFRNLPRWNTFDQKLEILFMKLIYFRAFRSCAPLLCP